MVRGTQRVGRKLQHRAAQGTAKPRQQQGVTRRRCHVGLAAAPAALASRAKALFMRQRSLAQAAALGPANIPTLTALTSRAKALFMHLLSKPNLLAGCAGREGGRGSAIQGLPRHRPGN